MHCNESLNTSPLTWVTIYWEKGNTQSFQDIGLTLIPRNCKSSWSYIILGALPPAHWSWALGPPTSQRIKIPSLSPLWHYSSTPSAVFLVVGRMYWAPSIIEERAVHPQRAMYFRYRFHLSCSQNPSQNHRHNISHTWHLTRNSLQSKGVTHWSYHILQHPEALASGVPGTAYWKYNWNTSLEEILYNEGCNPSGYNTYPKSEISM